MGPRVMCRWTPSARGGPGDSASLMLGPGGAGCGRYRRTSGVRGGRAPAHGRRGRRFAPYSRLLWHFCLSYSECPEGSSGLAKHRAGSVWAELADLVFALFSSSVGAAAGGKTSPSTILRTNGVFAADLDVSLVVSPSFALLVGDLWSVSVLEVGEVAVLGRLDCGVPVVVSGPITLVSRTLGLLGFFGDADGPPRGGLLDRAIPVLPAR